MSTRTIVRCGSEISCATNSFIGPPHLVLDPQGAAGILPKSSDERKRCEAFPQSRLVGQTKQSHLTWYIGSASTAAHAHLGLDLSVVKNNLALKPLAREITCRLRASIARVHCFVRRNRTSPNQNTV